MSVLSQAFEDVFAPHLSIGTATQPTPHDPVDWISNHFYVYDTRELFEFHEPIEVALREALRRDENGDWLYDLVLWSWIKKSAKSTVIAAVAHYIASTRENARIALMGNDLRQATSRVGTYLREAIKIAKRQHPDDLFVQDIEVPVRTSGDIRYPNGSLVEMLPIDPTGEAGGNHDMIVFSELWGWRHKAHEDMWAEMTISPTRYGRAQRWIDTYAGFRGASNILESLYNNIVTEDNRIHDTFEMYANGRQFAVWNTVPTLPWQTPEYYASEASTLHPMQYERMHHNQWADSTQSFTTQGMWELCRRHPIPKAPDHIPWVFAVDAGVSNDLFAIVGVQRRDVLVDGERVTYILPGYCQTWKAAPGEKINFDEPEAELRRLVQHYRVLEINYDPYQLHSMMTRLRRQLPTDVREFPQGVERLKADKQLYDMVLQQRICHDDQTELTAHMVNADADINKLENRLRIIKRRDDLKIDAAVAFSMAAYRAQYLNIGILW